MKKLIVTIISSVILLSSLSGCLLGSGQTVTVTDKKTGGSITITEDTVIVDGMVIEDDNNTVIINKKTE